MNGETIKSFLVSLGFGVDESSLAKFNKSITAATVKVTALYTSINVLAAGVAKAITGISGDFEDLGYELKILAPAINKALVLRQEMFKAYAAAGINFERTVVSAARLNLSITKTKIALEAIYRSVGARFFPLLIKQSDLFRKKLYENMPKIQDALEKFVKIVFKALEIVTSLGLRVWEILSAVFGFFVRLNEATGGWSTVILGVVAAWRLLNLSFLATPLGMIIAGIVALIALWDDFKVWKDGGQSLFNWTNVVPIIDAVTNALGSLWDIAKNLIGVLLNLWSVIAKVFKSDFSGAFDSFLAVVNKLYGALSGVLNLLKDIWALNGAIGHVAGSALASFFSGPNSAQNLQNNPIGRPLANPVGSNVQNSQVNQNVHQQTSINVMGSADASATGQAVASQQGKVNFDLTRNFKPAAR